MGHGSLVDVWTRVILVIVGLKSRDVSPLYILCKKSDNGSLYYVTSYKNSKTEVRIYTNDTFRGIERFKSGESFTVGFVIPLAIHTISFDPSENLKDSNRTERTSSAWTS